MQILNYRIIRQLGSGGMGQVFLAQNVNINQLVAIKSLHPQFANNQALRDRFKQEAIMLNSLDHPNIVKFLNYVENEYGVFLIMEYVEGYTLEEFINKKSGLIVEQRAYPMMCEILDAFLYAHERGIIHRDIKPSNIFINNEGHIKVMDFGIAQILTDVATGTEPIMGTPEYMSPEQVYGHHLDQRSDIYSLGVLFHQMLTGRAPYDSTTMSAFEIKKHVINDRLPRMKDYYPFVSDGVQKVVDKATSKEQEKRYGSCAELKKALKKVLDPEPVNRMGIYVGVGVAIALIGVIFGVWDYTRTKVYYYKDYAERFGVPEGVGELSKREMEHRSATYRMEYSQRKLRRLTLVNSAGKAVWHSDTEHHNSRYSDVEYFYSDNGQIDYQKVYDPYGKLLFKLDYDEKLRTATFRYDDEFSTAMRLPSSTTELHIDRSQGDIERSRISRYLLDFDQQTGLLRERLYAYGDNNDRVGDKDNIYGQQYEYDEKGRVITVRFLGQDRKLRANHFGLAIKRYTYDGDDNWSTVSYYSADGKPSHDGQNCPVVTLHYDEWGNRVKEVYTTADGKPAMRSDTHASGFKYEYDDNGCQLTQSTIDGKGNLMTGANGFATRKMVYDENHFITECHYLDIKGNPANYIEDGDAYSIIKLKNNDVGLSIENSFHDKAGKLLALPSGVAKVEITYDSVGNKLSRTFIGKDGKKVRHSGYSSTIEVAYDEFSRPVREMFKGPDGKLTDGGNGTCGSLTVYDRQGNVALFTCVGTDGKTPVRGHNRWASISYKYDEAGNNISRTFLDENGIDCLTGDGYSRVEYVYEPKTNFLISERYNTLTGILYVKHYQYDSNGNKIKEYRTNAAGQLYNNIPVNNYEYDGNNRIVKVWTTNLKGETVNAAGTKYAQQTYVYDNRGNRIKITMLDTKGKPAVDNDGAYQRIHKYDDNNNVIYEKNVGPDGKPVSGKNANPEGKVTYDERGNQTSIACYDGYGKPRLSGDGFHKKTITYDDRNNPLVVTYTDTDNNLVCAKSEGWAKCENTYDDKGRAIKSKFYGSNGKLDFQAERTYNSHDMVLSEKVTDANGRLNDKKWGSARYDVEYDKSGVVPIRRKFYNAAGKLVLTQPYNAKTGQWGDAKLTGEQFTVNAGGWRTTWQQFQQGCPQKAADGLVFKRVNIKDTSIEVYIQFTTLEKSEMESNMDNIKAGVLEARSALRQATSLPSNIALRIFVTDKNSNIVIII